MSRNPTNKEVAEGSRVIAAMNQYLARFRSDITCWYAGVTSDYEQRLSYHRVPQPEGRYIAIFTSSEAVARLVEAFYHEMGMKGAGGGGTGRGDVRWIYIYQITKDTRE